MTELSNLRNEAGAINQHCTMDSETIRQYRISVKREISRKKFLSYFVIAFFAVSAALIACDKNNGNNNNGNTNGNGNGNGSTGGGDTLTEQLKIGQSYQGGIIAYIDATGKHGFIAAPEDQSAGIEWTNMQCPAPNVSDESIGSGKNNTIAIVEKLGTRGNYAAKLCNNLVLNGYIDWFLPSKDELNELFINRHLIGGFDYNSMYWSSSVSWRGFNYAFYQDFSNGESGAADTWKSYNGPAFRVRAIRYF